MRPFTVIFGWVTLCAAISHAETITREFHFPVPEIRATGDGDALAELPACDPDLQPGKPVLPSFPVTMPIPDGQRVSRIEVIRKAERVLSLPAPIRWCGQAVASDGRMPPATFPDPAIKETDGFYPASGSFGHQTDTADRQRILSLALAPLQVNPVRNEIAAAGRLTLRITLEPEEAPSSRILQAPPSPLSPGRYSYLVVAPSNLLYRAPAPWNFQTLCEAREAAGHTTVTVSTEWIDAHYTERRLAERIRAFVQDAHRTWGVRYLLLGGTHTLIPSPMFHIRVASIPTAYESYFCADAIFYGCLDGPMDGNGNDDYGELTDGEDGRDIDFAAEVLVGRFPVSNAEELAHMVRKTLAYEQAAPEQFRANAFLAERIDAGTQVYAGPHMEEIRLGSAAMSLNAYGYLNGPFAPFFDTATLYESDTFKWNGSDALTFLNADWHTVNHLGHGSLYNCMKIALDTEAGRTALAAYTNTMPWIIYSQACDSGAFNYPDCFAEQIVTAPAAAAAAVMNTDNGWFFMNTVGGPSQRFHRAFWDAAFRGTATTLGECQERSRQLNLYQLGSTENYWRWVYLELTLFGDPAMPFAPRINPTPAVISHDPLLNTYVDDEPYTVSCELAPIGLYDPSRVSLVWEADTAPGVLHTQLMAVVSGACHQSAIPAHPRGTRIRYRLHALTRSGVETRFPEDEPVTFDITERLTFQVLGSPDTLGLPTPDYGIHFSASGRWITVTAPDTVYLSDDERFTFNAFVGTGSVPQRGATNCTFLIHQSSTLVWMGQREYLTTVSDTPGLTQPGFLWTREGEEVPLYDLPNTIIHPNGTRHIFSEWMLDGIRTPSPPAACLPTRLTLTADSPHTLVARYLPETLDSDGNGLQDWWERKYFGLVGCSPKADPDGDGYTLAEELAAWTNPLIPEDIPRPPAITFTPFSETLATPAPYTLEATLTDPREIQTAMIEWQAVNGADPSWNHTPLLPQETPDRYAATFAEGIPPGTLIRYRVTADNPAGYTAVSETHESCIAYPILDAHLLTDRETCVHTTQTVEQVTAYLFNVGNRPLTGKAVFAAEDPITPERLAEWDFASPDQPWTLSTNRVASPPYSLHAQLASNIRLEVSNHATVTLATCSPGRHAVLSFDHWIYGENDTTDPTRAFDGGIVEYSVDGGQTYHQLPGPYTHTIYGWDCSPWPDGTPCFSGTGEEGWRHIVFDLETAVPELNGFAGQPVRFRFHLGGDNNTDNEGWYIDNVRVSPLAGDIPLALEPENGFSIAAGDYLPLLLDLFPQRAAIRTQTVKIEVETNDPAQPEAGFFWSFKVREEPTVTFTALQEDDGQGRMTLTGSFSERDGEPLTVTLCGTVDGGTNWIPIALSDLQSSVQTNLPATLADGTVNALATFTDIPVTNTLTGIWHSLEPLPGALTYTRLIFRVTADNGAFPRTETFGPFVLDNEPPRFPEPPVWTCEGGAAGDHYGIQTPDLPVNLTFTWAPASDYSGLFTNRLTVTFNHADGTVSNLVTELPPDANSFPLVPLPADTRLTVRLSAVDRFGNECGPTLSNFTLLSPEGDYDQDGFTNAEEEEAGTSPLNDQSRFSAGIARDPANGALLLVWPTLSGRVYWLETTESLNPANWVPFSDEYEGTGNPISVPLTGNRPAAFFRLHVRKAQP